MIASWSAINPARKHDSVDWPTNRSNQAWAQSSSRANGIWMCLVDCATQNERGDAYWLYCVLVWTGWLGDAKCAHTPRYTKCTGWTNVPTTKNLFGSWAKLGLLCDFPAEVWNVWDCLVLKQTCFFPATVTQKSPVSFHSSCVWEDNAWWEPACFLVEHVIHSFSAERKQTRR